MQRVELLIHRNKRDAEFVIRFHHSRKIHQRSTWLVYLVDHDAVDFAGFHQPLHRFFPKQGTRRMPLFSICLPEKINEIRLSDNSSFWDQGYPALMLTDKSYQLNPNHHRMTEVTLGVAWAMRQLL